MASLLSILVIGAENNPHRHELVPFLEHTASSVTALSDVPADLTPTNAIIVTDPDRLRPETWSRLTQYVNEGGICFTFAGLAQSQLPKMFGVQPYEPGPRAEIRVLFRDGNTPLAHRLPEAFYVQGQYQAIDSENSGADVILYTDWRYVQQPVLTTHQFGKGTAVMTTLQDSENAVVGRIIYRLIRSLCQADRAVETLGIGLLGYAPSVGQLHATGAINTPGLTLEMVCDLDPARLQLAGEQFPDVRLTESAADLVADPEVDVVIIATPPNSHARLAELMLSGGKHVICEKPLALTLAEAEGMQATAKRFGRHLSCHQNRRWDNDYRMIKQALADGLLGEPFYLETFVGGYGHPCGFWHSHEPISGGTTFDWGAHYLDWVLDLLPGDITSVSCTRQNRVWHDITNADRERIQLRYADGTEAEFAHSDLAFIPKPKWYLVGTEGALLGKWQKVDTFEVDPIHFYQKHEIPASEMGAEIIVRRRNKRGDLFEQSLPEPQREAYPFHANLADHLLLGEPIEVPLAHTLRVMAVLDAARRSAEENGRQVAVTI